MDQGSQKRLREISTRAKQEVLEALTIAAEGRKGDSAKPMKGLGSGVFEIVMRYKSNAWRVVYAVEIGEDIWVIHAFQIKSKTGIKTPKQEIDLVRQRIKAVKEMLKWPRKKK